MPSLRKPTLAALITAACTHAYADSTLHLADATRLQAVTVHAEQDDFDVRREASSTRLVYGREELDRMNELSVGDYLRRLPSVTFTGPPGTPKDVRMRGMDKGYTQILIDGEPVLSGTKERQIQVDRIPLDMVERIEIIRAPTADMPNAGLSGTINIVLREAPEHSVANARIVTGRVFGEKTDQDTWNLSGQYGGATDHVRWLLNVAAGEIGALKTKRKSEQGFNVASGERSSWKDEFEDERVSSATIDFSPRINIRLDEGDELILSPWLSRNDEQKDKVVDKFKYNSPLTGTDYVADGRRVEEEDKLRETRRLRGEWRHKLEAGGQLAFFAARQQGSEDKDKTMLEYNALGVLSKTTLETDRKHEEEWYSGVRLERPLGNHTLGAGIEYKELERRDHKEVMENGAPKVPGRGDNFDIDERLWTAWLQDEMDLGGGHVLTPGVRMLRSEQSAMDSLGQRSGSRYTIASPSLHYLWQLSARNNLRASVTESIKPPKYDDISTVTETKAGTLTDPDKSGNAALQPEQALGLELGWEHFLPQGGGVFGVNLFHRAISDMVARRVGLEDGRYVERPYNIGDARVWGAELDARARLDIFNLPQVMLRFNYTRLESEITNDITGTTTRINDQPPYVYNIGFDWQLPQWDAAWGVNYNYTPKYLKNPTEPLKADDEAEQQLLDMYVMKQFGRDLSLRITAANLLDMVKDKDKYEYDTSGQKTKFIRESERGGRALYVALEGRF